MMPPPVLDKVVPDAYHGTHRDNVEPILTGGFNISTGDAYWLGDGVYFVEGSLNHAGSHARRKGYRGKHVVILRSTIQLGRCLDLHNADYQREIQNFAAKLIKSGLRPAEEITDGFVINLFCKIVGNVDTVRATWCKCEAQREEDPDAVRTWAMHSYSQLAFTMQLAICVRNVANILHTEKVERTS